MTSLLDPTTWPADKFAELGTGLTVQAR